MTSMERAEQNYFQIFIKSSVALVLCLVARLIPLRAPNIEPIFAVMMPFSKAYGAFVAFSFTILSILIYDISTGTLGVQTFFTAGAYGIISLWSASYFKNNKENKWNYVHFAIFGTLLYDALTGLTVGPIFFHQSFLGSLVGQIPFTALHLFGNITFALVLSPAVYNFLIKKPDKKLEKKSREIIGILHPKTI